MSGDYTCPRCGSDDVQFTESQMVVNEVSRLCHFDERFAPDEVSGVGLRCRHCGLQIQNIGNHFEIDAIAA